MSIELTKPTQVAPGEVLTTGITASSSALVAMGAGTTVLSIAGGIRTTEAWGVYIQGGLPTQQVVVEASGSIVVSGSGLNLAGIQGGAIATPQIKNYGSIQVNANGAGVGISITGPGSGHLNAGSIQMIGTGYGVQLEGHGSSDFQNTGSILAVGSAVTGVRFLAETAFFINGPSGSIRAFGSVSSVGMYVGANQTQEGAGIRNYGLIEGSTALQVVGWNTATPSIEIVNANGGVLRGKVLGSAGAERMTNLGVVEGEIVFGAGNDLYVGQGAGRASGMIQGGEGLDTLMGGDLFDYLHGNQGDDSLSGGAGDDWVVGGQGGDIMRGDDGLDLLFGNLGDDTMDGGAGADTVRGGQGNDSVSGGAGADFIAGDRGDDTLSGGAGADQFHSFGDAGVDRIVDFSRAQGDVLNLLAGSTYTVTQAGSDVIVSIGGGATVILENVQLSSLTGNWLTVG